MHLQSINSARVEPKTTFKGALKLPNSTCVRVALEEYLDNCGDTRNGITTVFKLGKDINLNFDNYFYKNLESETLEFLRQKGCLNKYVHLDSPSLSHVEFDTFVHMDTDELLEKYARKRIITREELPKRA